MDLLCCELSNDESCRTYPDPVILNDDRVLENLLKTEDRYMPSVTLFECVQQDITVDMRKIVAEWMLEVCEVQKCQEEVFPLSMNYMDRFLSICPIRKNHLQILGATCLLLASKIREPKPIPVEMLVLYTDNSITNRDLLKYEMFVVSKLKWDLSAITPHDFINQIINRLPKSIVEVIDVAMISRHARTFIAFCAKEFSFSVYTPSLIASAAIAAALYGLGWNSPNDTSEKSLIFLLKSLQSITAIEQKNLYNCLMKIEEMITNSLNNHLNNSFSDVHDLQISCSKDVNSSTIPSVLVSIVSDYSHCKSVKSEALTDVNDVFL